MIFSKQRVLSLSIAGFSLFGLCGFETVDRSNDPTATAIPNPYPGAHAADVLIYRVAIDHTLRLSDFEQWHQFGSSIPSGMSSDFRWWTQEYEPRPASACLVFGPYVPMPSKGLLIGGAEIGFIRENIPYAANPRLFNMNISAENGTKIIASKDFHANDFQRGGFVPGLYTAFSPIQKIEIEGPSEAANNVEIRICDVDSSITLGVVWTRLQVRIR